MLVAGDGHQVIVLERDPAGPPDDPAEAWEQWQRPGLNQFRLPHAFLGGFREVLDTELPEVSKALQDAGALRVNFIRDVLPAEMSGGWRRRRRTLRVADGPAPGDGSRNRRGGPVDRRR
jgi:hypothetical protein